MNKDRQQFEQELNKLLSQEQIKKEEPLSRHTTFRVGGAAEYFVMPAIAQVPDVVALCRQYEMPLTVIGNGSNLLVSDEGLEGVVLELGRQPRAFASWTGRIWRCRRAHFFLKRLLLLRKTVFPAWSLRLGFRDPWAARW